MSFLSILLATIIIIPLGQEPIIELEDQIRVEQFIGSMKTKLNDYDLISPLDHKTSYGSICMSNYDISSVTNGVVYIDIKFRCRQYNMGYVCTINLEPMRTAPKHSLKKLTDDLVSQVYTKMLEFIKLDQLPEPMLESIFY